MHRHQLLKLTLGLQKCAPRGFLTEVAVRRDYARYENTPRDGARNFYVPQSRLIDPRLLASVLHVASPVSIQIHAQCSAAEQPIAAQKRSETFTEPCALAP